MPPWKGRRCRRLGGFRGFKPLGMPAHELQRELLALDEFEALRLCDLEGKNQSEAAEAMEVSRGTVQRLLSSGRRKLVKALLERKILLLVDQQQSELEKEDWKNEFNENSFSQQ